MNYETLLSNSNYVFKVYSIMFLRNFLSLYGTGSRVDLDDSFINCCFERLFHVRMYTLVTQYLITAIRSGSSYVHQHLTS